MASSLRERIFKYKYLVHVVVALLSGGTLIYLATIFANHPRTHNVLNELGIAIVIASIVTLMYETYAREVLAQETMSRVIETVMGDMFDAQLWEEMRRQLLQKTAVRRECIVRVRMEPNPQLPNGCIILWVSLAYRLHGLRTKTDKLHITHNLDRFMQDKALDLPRFTHIEIGSEVIDPRKLNGQLEFEVPVESSPYGTAVLIERREIIYTPGAYHLIMSELTFVENVFIEDVAPDISVEINWTIDQKSVTDHQCCAIKRLLMPGHAIELRFSRRTPADEPLTA